MPNFQIEIREMLSRVIEIEADTFEEAYEDVKEQYFEELIILTSEDYLDCEIREHNNG